MPEICSFLVSMIKLLNLIEPDIKLLNSMAGGIMQFEIKVRILYAPEEEYCTIENGVLEVGPLPSEWYEEPFNAMDYFYMQSSYLAKEEYTCTIYGTKETHYSGITPVDDIIALQDSPNMYVDWRGIRRGTYYQFFVYVYLVREANYQKCIDDIQGIFVKHNINLRDFDCQKIDNTKTPIKTNGCFDFPSPFRPEFIRFDKPCKEYHEFFRDNEEEIHVFEKYTSNSERASWDKELPAEGDSTAWVSWLLELGGIILPLILGKIAKAKIKNENRFISQCKRRITEKYDVQGYLHTKAKYATNSKGKKVHIIQENRGSRVLWEYEIEIRSGKIRRFKCS